METKELIGRTVTAKGHTFQIAKIVGEAYNYKMGNEDNWYIEFLDPKGNYHYWKQECDGGELR